jgi:hypothetical protein
MILSNHVYFYFVEEAQPGDVSGQLFQGAPG